LRLSKDEIEILCDGNRHKVVKGLSDVRFKHSQLTLLIKIHDLLSDINDSLNKEDEAKFGAK